MHVIDPQSMCLLLQVCPNSRVTMFTVQGVAFHSEFHRLTLDKFTGEAETWKFGNFEISKFSEGHNKTVSRL